MGRQMTAATYVITPSKQRMAERWIDKLLAEADRAATGGRYAEADQLIEAADRMALTNHVAWEA